MNEKLYLALFVATAAWIGINEELASPLLVTYLPAVLVWAGLIGSEVSK